VVGSRFAWATRNVRIAALNDSTYVGMSLYNVVLLSITTAVVGYFLRDQHERSYIVTSVFILLCVTITLCLVFVPKVRVVAKDPHSSAKPQRAVVSVIEKNALPNHDTPKKDNQVWQSKVKLLTQHNETLRKNTGQVGDDRISRLGFESHSNARNLNNCSRQTS
jgi:Na+/melibiose symporter-like transporter